MSQVKEPKNLEALPQNEAQIAPATPVEQDSEINIIRLSAEGQIRLVEMIEDENEPPPSETLKRAKQASDLLFGPIP